MNGVHDLGGMDCFGKVVPEPDEPVFHAPWEGRVLAMQRAMAFTGAWNIDMVRWAQERLPPPVYLSVSYYERWACGLESMLVQRGLAGADELTAGHALRPGMPLKRKLRPELLERALTRGGYGRPAQAPARFAIGDRVRAKNLHPKTHTRLPRYVRGHLGVVERVHGCHVYPDTVAMEQGEHPQWLYAVRFDARELWGPDADPTVKVCFDAFEPYLDPA
jgi:nitrile hydratase beta subunit